ncbi:MAG: amino acid adenylation domain-containing protein [Longimicrobiaceae bacterium]
MKSFTAEELEKLSPERRALLQKMLDERSSAKRASQTAPGVPRREGGGPAPLSFAQQRLWLLDRIEPGSPAYNMAFPVRLRGRLDARILERTLSELVRRHESLRTRLPVTGDVPVQVIEPARPVRLPRVDLGGLVAARREADMRRLAEDEALRSFDLAAGPLLRAVLVRLDADDHALLFTLHHVVSDGWSMAVLEHEMWTIYSAFARGERSPLPELPVQYADYAVWQRAWLSGAVLEAQLGWWRERLVGAPPVLELPTDRPRRPVAAPPARTLQLDLDPEDSRGLRELTRREAATLFMALLPVFAILLARYSGQDDVVVGSPVAGRTRGELEGLIGFFSNTLVLRTDVSGDPTYLELLRRTREATLGAFAHQDLPFERLVEELAPERSLAHTPLFQVMFAFGEAPAGGGAPRPEGMRTAHIPPLREVAKFDLSLTMEDGKEGVAGALIYRSDLFEEGTIERMAGHFRALVKQVIADPGRRVGSLDLFCAAERARLVDADPTPVEYPGSVHALFAAQAARTPDAVAVVSGGGRLSYAELDRAANRLANHLRGLGVGPETRVGVCMERSAELATALLGVLRTGGAYVPLDPGYPRERLAFVLEDSGAAVLLTHGDAAEGLAAPGVRVLRLDADAERIAAAGEAAPAVDADPDGLAYVIYTSGSTGVPKGVGIPHRALSAHMRWMQRAYPLSAADRVLQKTPVGFDASVWEFWAPLLAGATLVMAPPGAHRDPAALARTVERERISVLQVVPSFLGALLDDGRLARHGGLRRLFCGGEALPAAVAERARAATGAEVVNLYGPTEACIDSVAHTFAGSEAGATVPIGRAVDGVRTRVLDRAGNAVPVGIPGELHLGGAQLARGYLGRPELTAGAFVPDPFAAGAGERLYRTGDRVRLLPAGTLEFLGRMDEQVKVRGFRIEPAEVEAALRGHPGVRDAVVAARGDRLVGYHVPSGAEPADAAELRAFLGRTLPEHMVPSTFVALEALPRTPGGKLDRRALPAPESTSAGAEHAPPRTPTETALAAIFAGVLGVERVGAHSHFFDLGGHSLLATRLVTQVREQLGVELPLRAVFEAPTVARLAELVDAGSAPAQPEHAEPAPPPATQRIPRRAGGGPAPLSFAQQRLWFIHKLDPASPAYNMPRALRLRGALDVGALRRSLTEVVRRHEVARTRLVEQDGEAVQVVLPPAPFRLPAVDLSGLAPERREAEGLRRIIEEGERPFDLGRGLLLRGLLVHLGPDDRMVQFTMHHAVSDGWSMGVLTGEVSALYGAYSRGGESPLPELPIQYADFAVWQRRWLSGAVLGAQLDFWREQLADAPPLLDLPADHPRRTLVGAAEESRPFSLPAGPTAALRRLARAEGATLFMTLLAAWQALLGRYAGVDDVVVGTPIANRTRAEVEGLIGFFVNTLVLRTDLSGDPSFLELLERVRETTLGAYQHQDLPFERLVEELAPERSLLHNPLFQVMFALQNTEAGALALGDVDAEPLGGGRGGAKFDVGVSLFEVGERIEGELTYRGDLFEASTIDRMAGHFRLLLEGAVADPGHAVSGLRLVGPEEERRVLEEWNPPRDCPDQALVPRLLREQAARTPDAPAASGGGLALTHAELDRRSDRLARALRSLGVGPETPVGVCLERGPALLVAVLGVWKAGGAYLPLDPDYPVERLAYVLRDAAAPVVLTEARLAAALPEHGARAVLLDPVLLEEGERAAAGDDAGPAPEVDPDNLAYVIYTSGSTGHPKGVRVSHRSLLATVHAALDAFGFGPDDVTTSLASFAFDIWLFEAVLPLLAGGSVRLVPRERVLDTERLLEDLASCTAVHAVPALMRQTALVLRASGRTLPRVRRVYVGGDAVPPDLLEEMREVFPAASIHVLYGPTEAAVICAAHESRPSDARRQWVGRPLGNAALYVLDRALRPVPVGVPGELCIGGASVARDYLGRPAQTAEKWVPDPFGARERSGARLYRTGDRVRWTGDGELEFLGRTDTQVKIRGFRIEPGEVEATLAEHPGVEEAVVAVREDTPGDRRLVGYVVPAAEDADGVEPAALQEEHVREWEALFGDAYGEEDAGQDPAFHVAGWNSSYTGEPIPEAEMREWVEHAAGRVRDLRPRRVLEIGCGTGLLLFRVAPECEEYWGADFSAEAIGYLRRQLGRPGRELPQVRLMERVADDFTGIPAGHFDVVVVNSVAQYFPGVDYLLRVIDGAVGALAPGGTLWVGDVRSLPLLEAFHASVELAQASAETPAPELRDRVRRRAARDKELLVAPELFRALPSRLPRVSAVEIRLKEGRHANEMTRFRYDAAVRVERPPSPAAPAWRRWDAAGGLAALARELDERAPDAVAFARVPNARVAGALALPQALAAHEEARSAEELRALAAERDIAAVDPEALRELGEARGYRVHARPSAWGAGELDVLLARGDAASALVEEVLDAPPTWAAWASDPLAGKRSLQLLPELRGWLRERLPDYMVPGALVLLERLPLTPNGKVDRRALPAPEAAGDGAYASPRTATEETLAGIWAAVLRVERVGVEDDFFALGGHSLLATRMVSRIREALGVEVPLRALFEAPTVARLGARVDDLLRAGAGVQLPPLRPAPRDGGPLPLSFAQQRLWFIHQLDPRSPAYNMPSPLRLRGPLRPDVLERVLAELVRRHESLRTVFASAGGEPVQVIRPVGPAALPVVDLRGLAGERRVAMVQRLAATEAGRPFDLARGPLLRAALLRTGEEEWALLFTVHHVVSDGWSMSVLVREISRLYQAFARDLPSPLPEPRLQYADYAVWQRGWLAGEALERQLAFWREKLEGAPPLLELPVDHPRPPVAGERAAQRSFVLSVETSRALRALARREGATLFITLLAVYQALLARWSGQDDVTVGTPVAGRGQLELEPLVGFFVNMLVIRTGLSGRPGARELVGRVREGVLGAQAHQDLPFERLVDELQVERSLGRAPLFQVLFALLAGGPGEERLSLGDVEVYPLHGEETAAKFDLNLTLQDGGEALAGSLVYRTDLFEGATIERMLGHFRVLADAIADEPDRSVSDFDLLAPAERAQLEGWNAPERPHAAAPLVHDLFAAQAVRTPDAVAVSWRGEPTTYAELERRSARLANALRRRGVGPETRVGVCLDRTPELLVCLLGVLRAGGAYVPLDPAHPQERLGFMIDDAGVALVLTGSALAGRLSGGGAGLFVLDRERESLSAEPENVPGSGVLPENLSHVIFTSGSTGKPKGVMIRHGSTAVLLHWLRENVTDRERSAVLFSTSISFDVSVAEIFGTLCWGGRLVLVENALELASVQEPVVYASMVPTAAAELLRSGGIPACVTTLNLGGEALPASLTEELYALGTVEKVGNLYGPTEDTTYSTYALVPRGADPVPVGRPVAGTRAYVLDANLLAVPVGVVGELYLAGDGLSRGYSGRPDLTAERYLPDPFGGPGDRMYRVMDRVRWRADGELEYFGRTDFQVKVRGFRIELGEIETALRDHPSIREAVVVAREDAPGEKRLVAYLVPAGKEMSGTPLHAHLAHRLPEYMIPAAIVVLDALPLTPNGKLDRRALPAPEWKSEAEYVGPRSEVEEQLCAIWAEVLSLERVGVHDRFFELGGHSLMGVRIISRIREASGVEVPLHVLFEAPTVAGLAAWIEENDPVTQLEEWEVDEEMAKLAALSDEDLMRLLGK